MSDDPKRVCYCIEVLDDKDNEWKIAYIGETLRGEEERDGEHEGLVGGASRVAASVAAHGRANHQVRIMDVVNDDSDRKALETYLMLKHGTLIHDIKTMRGLLAHENREFDHLHPDISLDGKPRNFQLNQRRSVGVKYQERVDAAGKAYEARCSATTTLSLFTIEEERALFEEADADLLANVEDVDLRKHLEEPLERNLVARASTADTEGQITFVIDSAFMCAREKRVKYENMVPSDVIDGNQLFRDVKSVREFVVDDDLKSRMRQMYLAVHPDQHASMPAGGVAALFKLLEQLAGVVEEAAIVVKAKEDAEIEKHMTQAKAWFEYMSANDGTTPSHQPTAKHKSLEEKKCEKYLGKQMANWRGGNGGPKQLKRNLYLVVLRDFETFAAFCYGVNELSAVTTANVNAMLRLGYGTKAECKKHPHLMHFPTTCVACKQHTKEYSMWCGYLSGAGEKYEEALLANLPPERVKTAKDMHNGKFEARQAAMAEKNKRQKEALHTTGLVNPRAKKAKTSAAAGSSSSSQDE